MSLRTKQFSKKRHRAGVIGSVDISTLGGCSWHADTPDPWIAITSARSGTTSETVTMSVAANTGAGRVGTVTISERTFTITQEAAANPILTPTPTPTPTPPPTPTPSPPRARPSTDTCPDADTASAGADSNTPTYADGEVFREHENLSGMCPTVSLEVEAEPS